MRRGDPMANGKKLMGRIAGTAAAPGRTWESKNEERSAEAAGGGRGPRKTRAARYRFPLSRFSDFPIFRFPDFPLFRSSPYAARQRTASSRKTSSCSSERRTISSNAAMNSCWLSIRRRKDGNFALPASLPTYQGFCVKRL